MRIYNIGFIMEQALGHVTHTMNLQTNVPNDPEVRAYWGLIPFQTTGIVSHIPVYNSNWTVRAGLRARRAVAGIARQTRLEALFFHTQVPAILATSWLHKIPGILSLDCTPIQFDELGTYYQHEQGPKWMESLKWRLNRDCYRAARHIVAFCEWTKRGLIDDYEVPADKITVIPPGVNVLDWKRPAPRVRRDGPVKILFVGGEFKRKGGLDLLKAFRRLHAQGKSIELHLATRDQLAPEPGVFVYNNMQPNSALLKQLYFDSDIFCLPTYGDCLPMVLSEAGAAGLPSISTQVAGIPEIIANGDTGFIGPPGDVAALNQALVTLIDNPDLRLKMGESATKRVAAQFDAERNTFLLLALVKSTILSK